MGHFITVGNSQGHVNDRANLEQYVKDLAMEATTLQILLGAIPVNGSRLDGAVFKLSVAFKDEKGGDVEDYVPVEPWFASMLIERRLYAVGFNIGQAQSRLDAMDKPNGQGGGA